MIGAIVEKKNVKVAPLVVGVPNLGFPPTIRLTGKKHTPVATKSHVSGANNELIGTVEDRVSELERAGQDTSTSLSEESAEMNTHTVLQMSDNERRMALEEIKSIISPKNLAYLQRKQTTAADSSRASSGMSVRDFGGPNARNDTSAGTAKKEDLPTSSVTKNSSSPAIKDIFSSIIDVRDSSVAGREHADTYTTTGLVTERFDLNGRRVISIDLARENVSGLLEGDGQDTIAAKLFRSLAVDELKCIGDIIVSTCVENLAPASTETTGLSQSADTAASSAAAAAHQMRAVVDEEDRAFFLTSSSAEEAARGQPQDELRHHQDQPNVPGYSFRDIHEMFRSQYPNQRLTATRMLTGVLLRRDYVAALEAYSSLDEAEVGNTGTLEAGGSGINSGTTSSSASGGFTTIDELGRPSKQLHHLAQAFESILARLEARLQPQLPSIDGSVGDDENAELTWRTEAVEATPSAVPYPRAPENTLQQQRWQRECCFPRTLMKKLLVKCLMAFVCASDLPVELPTLMLWALNPHAMFRGPFPAGIGAPDHYDSPMKESKEDEGASMLLLSPAMSVSSSAAAANRIALLRCMKHYLSSAVEDKCWDEWTTGASSSSSSSSDDGAHTGTGINKWTGILWGAHGLPPLLAPHSRRSVRSYEHNYADCIQNASQHYTRYQQQQQQQQQAGGDVAELQETPFQQAQTAFALQSRWCRIDAMVSSSSSSSSSSTGGLVQLLLSHVVEAARMLLDALSPFSASGSATSLSGVHRSIAEAGIISCSLLIVMTRHGSLDTTVSVIRKSLTHTATWQQLVLFISTTTTTTTTTMSLHSTPDLHSSPLNASSSGNSSSGYSSSGSSSATTTTRSGVSSMLHHFCSRLRAQWWLLLSALAVRDTSMIEWVWGASSSSSSSSSSNHSAFRHSNSSSAQQQQQKESTHSTILRTLLLLLDHRSSKASTRSGGVRRSLEDARLVEAECVSILHFLKVSAVYSGDCCVLPCVTEWLMAMQVQSSRVIADMATAAGAGAAATGGIGTGINIGGSGDHAVLSSSSAAILVAFFTMLEQATVSTAGLLLLHHSPLTPSAEVESTSTSTSTSASSLSAGTRMPATAALAEAVEFARSLMSFVNEYWSHLLQLSVHVHAEDSSDGNQLAHQVTSAVQTFLSALVSVRQYVPGTSSTTTTTTRNTAAASANDVAVDSLANSIVHHNLSVRGTGLTYAVMHYVAATAAVKDGGERDIKVQGSIDAVILHLRGQCMALIAKLRSYSERVVEDNFSPLTLTSLLKGLTRNSSARKKWKACEYALANQRFFYSICSIRVFSLTTQDGAGVSPSAPAVEPQQLYDKALEMAGRLEKAIHAVLWVAEGAGAGAGAGGERRGGGGGAGGAVSEGLWHWLWVRTRQASLLAHIEYLSLMLMNLKATAPTALADDSHRRRLLQRVRGDLVSFIEAHLTDFTAHTFRGVQKALLYFYLQFLAPTSDTGGTAAAPAAGLSGTIYRIATHSTHKSAGRLMEQEEHEREEDNDEDPCFLLKNYYSILTSVALPKCAETNSSTQSSTGRRMSADCWMAHAYLEKHRTSSRELLPLPAAWSDDVLLHLQSSHHLAQWLQILLHLRCTGKAKQPQKQTIDLVKQNASLFYILMKLSTANHSSKWIQQPDPESITAAATLTVDFTVDKNKHPATEQRTGGPEDDEINPDLVRAFRRLIQHLLLAAAPASPAAATTATPLGASSTTAASPIEEHANEQSSYLQAFWNFFMKAAQDDFSAHSGMMSAFQRQQQSSRKRNAKSICMEGALDLTEKVLDAGMNMMLSCRLEEKEKTHSSSSGGDGGRSDGGDDNSADIAEVRSSLMPPVPPPAPAAVVVVEEDEQHLTPGTVVHAPLFVLLAAAPHVPWALRQQVWQTLARMRLLHLMEDRQFVEAVVVPCLLPAAVATAAVPTSAIPAGKLTGGSSSHSMSVSLCITIIDALRSLRDPVTDRNMTIVLVALYQIAHFLFFSAPTEAVAGSLHHTSTGTSTGTSSSSESTTAAAAVRSSATTGSSAGDHALALKGPQTHVIAHILQSSSCSSSSSSSPAAAASASATATREEDWLLGFVLSIALVIEKRQNRATATATTTAAAAGEEEEEEEEEKEYSGRGLLHQLQISCVTYVSDSDILLSNWYFTNTLVDTRRLLHRTASQPPPPPPPPPRNTSTNFISLQDMCQLYR